MRRFLLTLILTCLGAVGLFAQQNVAPAGSPNTPGFTVLSFDAQYLYYNDDQGEAHRIAVTPIQVLGTPAGICIGTQTAVNVVNSTLWYCYNGTWTQISGTGGGGTPGGSNTQVQFDDNGTFNGTSSLTYNKSTGAFTHSGTETFMGPINCTILNTTACISPSNPQGWSGADVVTQLTSAISCISSATNCPANYAGSMAGGRIEIAAGLYASNGIGAGTITLTQPIEIVGDGWATNIRMNTGVGATPLLRFAPSGIIRGFSIRNIAFTTQSGNPGTYAVELDASPNNPFRTFYFDHIFTGVPGSPGSTSQFGSGSIWLNNTAGEADGGIYDSKISNCYLYGGILGTLIGDKVVIDNNLITDVRAADGGTVTSIGVDATFTPGASTFTVSNNTISTRQAGIHLGAATTFPLLFNNELEPQDVNVVGSNGAYVDLDGTVGNPVNSPSVYMNKFQIGANSPNINGLRVNYATYTNVLGNDWTRSTNGSCTTQSCADIQTTSYATFTRIRPNNFNGGDSLANILYDGAAGGQTEYEFGGQGTSTRGLIYRDSSAATTIEGAGAQVFGLGVAGANYIYDGQSNSVALAVTNAASTAPIAGTHVTVATLDLKAVAAPTGASGFTSIYMDSTSNWPAFKPNGNTAYLVPGITGTITLGSPLCATGTNPVFTTVGCASTTPGGSNTQMQFDDSGVFNGSLLTYNKGTTALAFTGSLFDLTNTTLTLPSSAGYRPSQYQIGFDTTTDTLLSHGVGTFAIPFISWAVPYVAGDCIQMANSGTSIQPLIFDPGYACLPLTGGTMTGKLITLASASGGAGFNLPPGTSPTYPVNGDLWMTATGLVDQIAGSTYIVAQVTGTISSGAPFCANGSNGAMTTVGCSPTGLNIETNTTPNASQGLLNFTTSTANATGLGTLPVNTSGGIEKIEVTGTLIPLNGGTGISTSASTGIPQINAGAWTVSTILTNGTTASTQTVGDNTAKVATDAFVLANANSLSGGITDGFTFWTSGSTLGVITPPTVNGSYACGYFVTGSAAVAPTCALSGIPIDATNPATLLYSDRGNFLNWTSGTTLTMPAISGQFASNFPFLIRNTAGVTLALTPTMPNNIDGGSSQTPSSLLNNWGAFVYNDNSNWYSIKILTPAAFGGTNCVNGVTWYPSTGISCLPAYPILTGDFAYTTHTLASGASGIFDLSAATGTAAFKVPVHATNTATAAGVIDFDSTNTNYHGYIGGADALFAGEASAIALGFIPKSSSATVGMLTASLCDEGITTANVFTCADTSGIAAPLLVATGTTAGFLFLVQGPTSAAVTQCAAANTICTQAPIAVTSYVITLPGAQPTSGNTFLSCTAANPAVCSWAAGGGANAALSNLASVSINTSLLAQASVDLGAVATPFRNLYLYGGATYGTGYTEVTPGCVTTATCVVTLPAKTTTLADYALDNLTTTAVNVALLTGAASLDLGATTTPWRNLYLYGGATYGTGYTELTPGAVTTATITLTLPATTGTLFESAGTNTALAAATFDLSPITGTANFKIPVHATNTATAAGVLDFDSTNTNYHGYIGGADAIIPGEASAIALGFIPKSSSATVGLLTASLCDEGITTANAFTCTDTAGIRSPSFTSTGTTAGFLDLPQGSTSASVAPCNTANSRCFQAPASVTAGVDTIAGVLAPGIPMLAGTSSAVQESYSGDSAHAVVATGKTGAITTATLCAATAGTACGQAGQYRVSFNFWGSGTACSLVTAGSVPLNITWTDEQGNTHTTVPFPLYDQDLGALGNVFHFNTSLATESAQGSMVISTNGTIIQYATTYNACTTGTGTYNLRATVEEIQ